MRKIFILISLFICMQSRAGITLAISPASAVPSSIIKNESPGIMPVASLATMKVKDFEKLTGKRMTLKEKIGFKIIQAKLKKESKKAGKGDYSKRSKTAFILSILSLATIILIPLSIVLAVISIILASKSLKVNNEDKKAKTAIGLSILALGIIVVGLLIYAIFVSDGAFKLFVIN